LGFDFPREMNWIGLHRFLPSLVFSCLFYEIPWASEPRVNLLSNRFFHLKSRRVLCFVMKKS
jgi:hypothetical protein